MAVLYDRPGTGKSLLAPGMFKQSGFNMLPVSITKVWQACWESHHGLLPRMEAPRMHHIHGRGGRHVRSRSTTSPEWDRIMTGKKSPIVAPATNKPFDLEPALLQRAPFHIHLDDTTFTEGKGTLDLLPKEEELIVTDTPTLAKMIRLTPGPMSRTYASRLLRVGSGKRSRTRQRAS